MAKPRKPMVSLQEKVRRARVSRAAQAHNLHQRRIAEMDEPMTDRRIGAVFAPIEGVVDQLERGEPVMVVEDEIVFRPPGENGVSPLLPAMTGMADTFAAVGSEDDITGLRTFIAKIEADEMLTKGDFKRCRRDLAWMRTVSKNYTPNQMKEFIDRSCIRAEFRAAGLTQ